jgi:hypothetical protein
MKFAALILLGALSLSRAGAAEEFRVTASVEEIPERGRVASCVLSFGGAHIAFTPPANAGMVTTDESVRTVKVQPFNGGYSITVTVLTNQPGTSPETLANEVGRNFAEGRPFDLATAYTGSGSAPQAEWLFGKTVMLRTRTVFPTVEGLVLAVSLTANYREFSKLEAAFANFLNTIKAVGPHR